MRASLFVIFISLLFAPLATAQNSHFVWVWNMAHMRQFCLGGEDDLKKLGVCRDPGAKHNIDYIGSVNQIVEDSVFELTAPKQIAKDRCIAERLNTLLVRPYGEVPKKSNPLRNAWAASLIRDWLTFRKAQLIERTCQQKYLN